MISSFRIVHSLVHATIALLCYQFLTHPEIFGTLATIIPESGAYQNPLRLVAVGGLTALFRVSDKISRFLIESVPLISPALRRLLSGHRYLEGDWPLIVIDKAKKELLYLGFANITYKGHQLVIAGRDWTADGMFALDFASVQSRFVGNKLQYWYEQGHDAELRGFTEVYFFPADARPDRHTGRFLDEQHTNVQFYGRRVSYLWWQKALGQRVRKEKDQIALARQLWDEFQPRMAEITTRPISASWDL